MCFMIEQSSVLSYLDASLLFRSFTLEERLEFLDTLNARQSHLPKGTTALQDGEECSEVGVILTGRLHLFHTDIHGNKNLMDTLGRGESIGLINAVGHYRLHISAIAMEDTDLLRFPVNTLLRDHTLTSPVQIRFLQNLTLALAQAAQRLTRKLEDSIRRSIRERLLDYLSAQAHQAGSRVFPIPLNRQDLADYLLWTAVPCPTSCAKCGMRACSALTATPLNCWTPSPSPRKNPTQMSKYRFLPR